MKTPNPVDNKIYAEKLYSIFQFSTFKTAKIVAIKNTPTITTDGDIMSLPQAMNAITRRIISVSSSIYI